MKHAAVPFGPDGTRPYTPPSRRAASVPARRMAGARRTYVAAETNRLLQDWLASCRSADDEVRGGLRTLRARSRELVRNNPYVEHYARLLGINIVGPSGFRLKVRTMDQTKTDAGFKTWKKATEEAWRKYLSGPVTVDGETDGVSLLHLVVETAAIDGEVFLRKFPGHRSNPFRYALQFVDADLVDETYERDRGRGANEVRMGVEVDAEGRRVAYWLRSPSSSYGPAAGAMLERVPAEEMLHLYVPRRPNQTRGVPWILSAMLPLRMIDKYEESAAVAARIGASKMVGFEPTEDAHIELEQGETPGGEAEEGPSSRPPSEEDEEFFEASPGSGFKVPWGHKAFVLNWDYPHGEFNSFRKGMLQKSGSGLGASYPSLANDPEGVNYSSLRGFLLLERDHWQLKQGWLERRGLLPWYRGWLPLASLSGELAIPAETVERMADARFLARGWPWVDPLKDVVAAKEAIRAGLSSRTRDCAERGDEFEEILEELAAETKLAAEKGVSIDDGPSENASNAANQPEDTGGGKPAAPAAAAAGNGKARPRGAVREALNIGRTG